MSRVAGLNAALKLYDSDKIKDRAEGGLQLRQIFANRDNVLAFAESAGRDSGEGWLSLFQCLFSAVVAEKRKAVRASSAAADKRLADAISLVRHVAEKAVNHITRKPFLALFRHLTTLLVYGNAIFPPAALDYAKTLRALLSFPPHLASLDAAHWRRLHAVCWAAVLGDDIPPEADGADGEVGEDEEDEFMDTDEPSGTAATSKGYGQRVIITQSMTELLSLLPILLASPTAPLLPPFPNSNTVIPPPASLGYTTLIKVHRFLQQHPAETSSHLAVLKCTNIVLGELELNSRDEVIAAGFKLLGPLVTLWGTKSKAVREELLIAFRLMLPFLAQAPESARNESGFANTIDELFDHLRKEADNRWGVMPIEWHALSFGDSARSGTQVSARDPFSLPGLQAGNDFSHDSALSWATLEMYADCAFYIHRLGTAPLPSSPTQNGRPAKRRRVEDGISALLGHVASGSHVKRTLALQTVIFLIYRHWTELDLSLQTQVRQSLVDALEVDVPCVQNVAFMGLASIAACSDPIRSQKSSYTSPPAESDANDWSRVWSHAIRKAGLAAVSRCAAHCANSLLIHKKINDVQASSGASELLRQLDVQGPPYPSDSICRHLVAALELSRSDFSLYALNLENKVTGWLERWDPLEASRTRVRVDYGAVATSTDWVSLWSACCRLRQYVFVEERTDSCLPECPIVDRVIEEHRTENIRQFLLHGSIPSDEKARSAMTSAPSVNAAGGADGVLDTRTRRVVALVTSALQKHVDSWNSDTKHSATIAERVRSSLDLVVGSLLFQGVLSLNGYAANQAINAAATRLIDLIRPNSIDAGDTTATKLLIWRAFVPLLSPKKDGAPAWPIMLRADEASGVRPDLMTASSYTGPEDGYVARVSTDDIECLLGKVWTEPSTAEILGTLVGLARQVFENLNDPLTSMLEHSYPGTLAHQDDDDFEPIRTAEMDFVPTSSTASGTERSVSNLLSILVAIRLQGSYAATAFTDPVRDLALINSLLSCEGTRYIQLGGIITQAVAGGRLRITNKACEGILDSIEEVYSTYMYLRNEDLTIFALEFLSCTLPVWLTPDFGTELEEHAMRIAQWLVGRFLRDDVSSWRTRLAVLRFLDEYLDYDGSFTLWTRVANDSNTATQASTDKLRAGPLELIANGLVDRDARARIRAATSTAGLYYLDALSPEHHFSFYIATMQKQPRQPVLWDSFLTDMLWKLNCLVTSSAVRHAALYHLYEIPLEGAAFNQHLRSGFNAAASRLGLNGIRPLFEAYAAVTATTLISNGQSIGALPPQLCGFTDRSEMLASVLEVMAPILLAEHKLNPLLPLCQDLNVSLADEVLRFFYTATARTLALHASELEAAGAKTIPRPISDALKAWPMPKKSDKLLDILSRDAASIAAKLFDLLSPHSTTSEITGALATSLGSEQADLFAVLTEQVETAPADPDLVGPGYGAAEILQALQFLRGTYPETSAAEIAMNSLTALFASLHAAFINSERSRLMKAIALIVAALSTDLSPPILQMLLNEAIFCLKDGDIAGPALALIKWAMDKAAEDKKSWPEMNSLVLRLGEAQANVPLTLRDNFTAWLADAVDTWTKSTSIRPGLDAAAVLWPKDLRKMLKQPSGASFTSVTESATRSPTPTQATALCLQLRDATQAASQDGQNPETFGTEAFWRLKASFTEEGLTDDGARAFVDLLAAVNGEVHPTESSCVTENPAISKDLVSRINKDPRAIRAAVVLSILPGCSSDDYGTRAVTYRMLSNMRSELDDMFRSGTLLAEAGPALALLRPPVPTPPQWRDVPELDRLLDDEGWLKKVADPSAWTEELCKLLCRVAASSEPIFGHLSPILDRLDAARRLLPLATQALLSLPKDRSRGKPYREVLSAYFTNALNAHHAHDDVLSAVISTVLHLRHYQPARNSDALAYEQWLDIDRVLLSRAAIKTGAYASALLFLETARSEDNKEVEIFDKKVQDILFDVYSNVDDPDGFYGVKTHNVHDALRRRLAHEGLHQRALGLNSAVFESALTAEETSAALGPVLHNLHHMGTNRLAGVLAAPVLADQRQGVSDPLLFELAWRMGSWDLPVADGKGLSSQASLYQALRALHREQDPSNARSAVQRSIRAEMLRLKQFSNERMPEITKTITGLLCLRELDSWLSPSIQRALNEDDFASPELQKFVALEANMDFRLAEMLTATRLSVLHAAAEREQRNLLGDLMTEKATGLTLLQRQCHQRLCELARTEGNLQAALNSSAAIQVIESKGVLPPESDDSLGHVLWMQHEHALAIQYIEDKIGAVKAEGSPNLQLAVLMGRSANWKSQAKQEAPHSILDMFDKAEKIAVTTTRGVDEQYAQICYDFAIFCDGEQKALSEAPELARLKMYRSRKEADLAVESDKLKRSRDAVTKKSIALIEAGIQADLRAIAEIEMGRTRYLTLAIRMYAKAFTAADKFDDHVTRMVSLWLEHGDSKDSQDSNLKRTADDIARKCKGSIERSPSHKYIFLAPQLSARLNRSATPREFDNLLSALLLRMAKDHPYHVLYQILTPAYGIDPSAAKSNAPTDIEAGREVAAAALLADLAASSSHSLASKAARDMRRFTDASIPWCLRGSSKSDGKRGARPDECGLLALKDLSIPPATTTVPVDLTGKYKEIARVHRYSSRYDILGGIHKPKKMTCIDSLGKNHYQIFKGDDDIRQDAVMEQVFSVTNHVLSQDRRTKNRQLRFRTYNVVPLAKKTGIIEFVVGSMGLGEWLKPAHTRYRRQDISGDVFRQQLMEIQDSSLPDSRLVERYKTNIQKFRPVMRHFFTEKHKDPMAWFMMRLRYSRSVAVCSMVGHILGIGDRHLSNVMIDSNSGEIVQIDFGIVFGVGQTLRIPEKVPFRLTNDMVDGLGITGVDGTFRRCSELTLTVLRHYSDIIMTVLEVFKHDPLYSWQPDRERVAKAQGGKADLIDPQSAEVQEKAERVLSGIRNKLSDALSVEYTVNMLIQQARDIENLAKIFHGWSAWY